MCSVTGNGVKFSVSYGSLFGSAVRTVNLRCGWQRSSEMVLKENTDYYNLGFNFVALENEY